VRSVFKDTRSFFSPYLSSVGTILHDPHGPTRLLGVG
jgi:hypothetical protein